jgi:hypothetical protein
MGTDTPMYPLLVEAIVDNMNVANREELIALIKSAQEPDPKQQEMAQAQAQAQMDYQSAQTAAFQASADESTSRARRNEAEVRSMVPKLENDRINALSKAASVDSNLTRDDQKAIKSAEFAIKERMSNAKIVSTVQAVKRDEEARREKQLAQLQSSLN